MEIVPLGDSAVIVRVREQFEDAPEETLDGVVRTFRHLRNAAIPGVIELAPDLDEVARHAQISTKEVVDLHSTTEYRVACIGFVPGFPFLAGLPKKLATPRRDVPRKEIPAGSVGVGGAQTGIYPLRSPGGWNLIGRTPLRLFDPTKNPPALLPAG